MRVDLRAGTRSCEFRFEFADALEAHIHLAEVAHPSCPRCLAHTICPVSLSQAHPQLQTIAAMCPSGSASTYSGLSITNHLPENGGKPDVPIHREEYQELSPLSNPTARWSRGHPLSHQRP